MKENKTGKHTITMSALLIGILIAFIAIILCICFLPSLGKAGLIQNLCLGILLIMMTILFGVVLKQTISSFINEYRDNRSTFFNNFRNSIGYIILWCVIIGCGFFAVCIVGALISSFTSDFIDETSLIKKVVYILFYAILLFVPVFIIRKGYKYWKSRKKFKKKEFSKYLTSLFLIALTVISIFAGADLTYNSALDLIYQKTKVVNLTDAYAERHNNTKVGPTYTLYGKDENGDEHHFSIDKKEYKYFVPRGGSNINRNVRVTFYLHSKVISELKMI